MGPSSNLSSLTNKERLSCPETPAERPGSSGFSCRATPIVARAPPLSSSNITLADWEKSGSSLHTPLRLQHYYPASCSDSPCLLQEILHQADLSPETTVNSITAGAVNRLYTTLTALDEIKREDLPAPCLYLNGSGNPVDFFPYQPTHLPDGQLLPAPDLNASIEACLHRLEEDARLHQQATRWVLHKAKNKA